MTLNFLEWGPTDRGLFFATAIELQNCQNLIQMNRNTNADVTTSSGGENKPMLAAGLSFRVPKLTKEQNRILEKIIEGAEIQVDWENGQYVYTLCEDCGDSSTVRRDTFERLKESGLIKLKWRPSIDVERWG